MSTFPRLVFCLLFGLASIAIPLLTATHVQADTPDGAEDTSFFPTTFWAASYYQGNDGISGSASWGNERNGTGGLGTKTYQGEAYWGVGKSTIRIEANGAYLADKRWNQFETPTHSRADGASIGVDSDPHPSYVGTYWNETPSTNPHYQIDMRRTVLADGTLTFGGQPNDVLDDSIEVFINGTAPANRVYAYFPSGGAPDPRPTPTQSATIPLNAGDEVLVRFINLGWIGGFAFDYVTPPQFDYSDSLVSGTAPTFGEASHTIVAGIRLGATIDPETVSIANADASGDGGDDDGLLSPLPAFAVGQTTYQIQKSEIIATGNGTLYAWVDFNDNNVFETTEFASTPVVAGAPDNDLSFSGFAAASATGTTFARMRFTSDTLTSADFATVANDGEVEDYLIDILSPGNFTINTTEGNACVAAGGTLGTTNFFTDLDGGTFGFGSGAADEIPSTDPYGAQITGGIFINTFSGFNHGNYTYVSNNQTPRNGSQHGGGIYDPVNGPTGRFFVSDPDVSTPTFSTELQSLTFGQSYEVSFWAADSELSTSQYNRIGIFADNVEIYNTGFLQNTTSVMEWKKYSFVYTHMSALPTVDLDIRSLETGAGGRDFFFDEVNINECVKTTDYSDAPTTGTTYGDAAHTVVAGIQLGDLIDADTGSLASPDADGDGTDDDGVTLPSMTLGETATVSVNVTGAGGYLQAWADWEKDGNFTGTYDQIALNVQDGGAGDTDGVANGVITLSVFPPWEGTNNVQTFARFRWSTTQDLNSTTVASDGEVEDYALTVQPALPVPPLGQCSVSQVSLGGTLDGGTSISGALSNNGLTATITGTSTNNQFGSARRILEDVSGTMTFTSSALLSDLELALWNIQASNLMGNFKVTLGDGTVISNPSFAIAYDIGVHPNFLADGSVGERLGKTTGSDGNTYVFDPHANGGNEQAAGRLIFPDLIDVPEGIKSFSFDIVDQPGNGPTGFFTFAGCVQGDFSDAPITGASYGEASHSIATGVQLGATITDELAAYDSPNADGDVDDGTILPALAQGTQETFTIKATGAGGYLQGWIDWDGSGTFDAGEQIATDLQDDGTGIDVAAGDGSIGFVVSVPATATTNQTFARFRWSTTSGLDSTTSASDGEVEDYALTITAGPPTLYVSNLPTEICQVNGYGWIDSHPIGMPAGETSPPFDIVTGEWYWDALGLPRRSNTRPPQEFSYDYSSDLAELETSLSATGVNEAWEFIERIEGIPGSASSVDFVDGGAVEHSVVTIEGAAGNVLLRHPALPFTSVRGNASATLNFTFPSDGVVYTRTRFADYQLAHNDPRTEYCQFRDFADAPDSFGKPFHLVRSGIQLGSGVTAEAGGYDDPNAAGDTSDDGVTLPATFEPGTIVTVPVSVSGSGFLNAWIDWDGNGVFDEPTEQIAADIQDPGGSGTINLSVTVPSDAVVGQTFARFRWSSAFDIGFSGAAFDGEVEDYQITINDTSPMLSGRLFIDNGGGGGGVAHDGLIGGTELGASVGTIALFDGTSNQLASIFVNADGTWDAMLPVGYSGTVQIVATANPGYRIISEDRSAVPGASNISETDGTYSFNATAGTSYSGLNIGLIAAPTLTQNQQASVSPGQVIELPHIYTASTSGNVSFALVDQISAPANGFTSTIFADADCDGAADTVMPALIAVTANQQICLVVRTQAGSGISPTATLTYGIEATTAFTGTAVIDVVRNDDALGSSGTGSDLVLRKVVSNETKAPGIESVSNTGDIGDVLQYRIVMTNPGPGAANDVTVTDATPAYTALSGPIPSPVAVGSGMSCSLVTPAANVAGYSGPLEWSCPGSLSSGAGGSVTFQVTITP